MAFMFRPEARDDVIAARDWHEGRAAGLGAEFVRALEAEVGVAQRSPKAFRLVAGEFRRVPLRRFPYFLVYQIQGRDLIILACFHHRRDPQFVAERPKP